MGNEYQKSLKVLFKKLESELRSPHRDPAQRMDDLPAGYVTTSGHDPQDSIRSQSMGQHAFRTETLRIHRLTQ